MKLFSKAISSLEESYFIPLISNPSQYFSHTPPQNIYIKGIFKDLYPAYHINHFKVFYPYKYL